MDQIEFRDVIARTALENFDLGKPKEIVAAATAAMGAAAIFIAMLPAPVGELVTEALSESLGLSVIQRRKEIDSGALDEHMERRQ